MKKLFLFLALLFSLTVSLTAQESNTFAETNYQNKILFLPAFGSTPETDFMFGAVVVPQFKLSGAGVDTRSSGVFFSGVYTMKNQILVSLVPDIILPGEKWIINGNYFVNYFPNSYWGIGPSSPETVCLVESISKSARSGFNRSMTKRKPGFSIRHRGSAVSLIIPVRNGRLQKQCLEIAKLLLLDDDGLFQKGYGWLLKAVSKYDQDLIYDFVLKHKETIPRNALRYAIEKMPEERNKKAMGK